MDCLRLEVNPLNIKTNVQKIKKEIPSHVIIIGVTKYVDAQVATELYDNGITHLGEN